MRFFYSLLFYLLLPGVLLRLFWRSLRLPDYRKRLRERLGFFPLTLKQCIWIHAVSVGEVVAAIPLITALKKHYVDLPILVTTTTPTGSKRVKAALGESVHHVYLPYDVPPAVSRFLNAMHPIVGIIMETELWPNLLAACREKKIPMVLINARLSEKSVKNYRLMPSLMKEMLKALIFIGAQSEKERARFLALGAEREKVVVTGNIKFDLVLPADLAVQSEELHQVLGKNRFIWIAASTHVGEEEILLKAHQLLLKNNPRALLILVPRHPDRFEAVANLCRQQEFNFARRSEQSSLSTKTSVYLGDTMGELLLLYSVSTVAFVGGSLVPNGGHNLLEPAALGKPILTGKYLFNFTEISELLLAEQALLKISNEEELANVLKKLLLNPSWRKELGEQALAVVEKNRGVVARQLSYLTQIINSTLH